MSSNPLPVYLYQSLLSSLFKVLQLTLQRDGVTTPASKQVLLQTTNEFKNSLVQAKDLVTNLPGGELLIEEQDDVIRMLEALRDQKRAQLEQFSRRPLEASAIHAADNDIEIDSMASTPAE